MRRARAALPGPLLVITDRHQARQPIETVAAAVGRGGGRWLLFRDKDLGAARAPRSRAASRGGSPRRRASHSRSVPISSSRPPSARPESTCRRPVRSPRRATGSADAVIGVSAHSLADVAAAAAAGADYVTLSPIFVTESKPGYGPALGIESLRTAAALAIPVLALAGVTAATAWVCVAAGASGVAVMGEVMRSHDPSSRRARTRCGVRNRVRGVNRPLQQQPLQKKRKPGERPPVPRSNNGPATCPHIGERPRVARIAAARGSDHPAIS